MTNPMTDSKNSIFGTVSLIIGLVWALSMIGVTFIDISLLLGQTRPNAVYLLFSKFSSLVFVAAPIGLMLGLIGLRNNRNKKVTSILGLIINGILTLFILSVIRG